MKSYFGAHISAHVFGVASPVSEQLEQRSADEKIKNKIKHGRDHVAQR